LFLLPLKTGFSAARSARGEGEAKLKDPFVILARIEALTDELAPLISPTHTEAEAIKAAIEKLQKLLGS